ncbi:unnamed protein product [Closterium sp. NIES-64]|nr:unnamed protein product [Closterium sp. NIES-64]CAI5944352.1 unnamed protein product [Closterium sp. NIES-64]
MKSNTTNHRSLFLADESHDESSDEQAQGRPRTGQRTKHPRRSLDDVNKADVAGKTVPALAAGVKSVAGGGPLDDAASDPFPAAAAAGGSSPAVAAAGSSLAAAAAGSSPAAAAAGPSRSAIRDGGSPPADVAPDAVVPAGTPAAVEGNPNRSPMELLMTRATGRAYATDAARFDEEARAEPDVNEELRTKAEAQKAIAGVYQKENGRLADDLKSALVLITHLAKKTTQVDQSTLVWKFTSCAGHAGYTPESAEGMQVAAIAKSQGKLKDAMERFNDRIGKIYRLCRVYALSRDPCVFMREKRTLKGELTFSEIDDFAKVCADFVKNQSDTFVKCASLWDPEFDGALPIALFPDQLLVILAAVRFKLRYPHGKAQFKRSGDPSAFSRQARVVQRWINEGPVERDGDCVGIGSICIVGWKEIPEAELEADELGDLTRDDLTSRAAYRRLHNANEPQVELF